MLGIEYLWAPVERIMRLTKEPPYKVLVKSGHKVGKSHSGGSLINWWYDSFAPSGVVSIAPRLEHLKNILWKEVRLQRAKARVKLPLDFIGPSAPEMRDGPDHYAIGLTANKGESITGRHEGRTLFVFDEGVGIQAIYWTTVKTMFRPGKDAWVVFANPTDTTSQMYAEDMGGGWHVVTLDAMDHPNIAAGLAGDPLPVGNAVTVDQIDVWVKDWCEPVPAEERQPGDFEWRPGTGCWWRPGPEFEARCKGVWPSAGTYGVWSELLWNCCVARDGCPREDSVPIMGVPEIGCDVARFGDDRTAIHSRWGNTSLGHESHHGWKITQTAGRLIELVHQLAAAATELRLADNKGRPHVDPKEIPIKVDDDGVGGGVSDILQEKGLYVVPVRSGTVALNQNRYPNKRCELWFASAARAREDRLALGRLDRDSLTRLRSQAMAVRWEMDSQGRRVVEPKDRTKEKLGHSPDDMDALNLAYYEMGGMWEAPAVLPAANREVDKEERREKFEQGRKRLFGR